MIGLGIAKSFQAAGQALAVVGNVVLNNKIAVIMAFAVYVLSFLGLGYIVSLF